MSFNSDLAPSAKRGLISKSDLADMISSFAFGHISHHLSALLLSLPLLFTLCSSSSLSPPFIIRFVWEPAIVKLNSIEAATGTLSSFPSLLSASDVLAADEQRLPA